MQKKERRDGYFLARRDFLSGKRTPGLTFSVQLKKMVDDALGVFLRSLTGLTWQGSSKRLLHAPTKAGNEGSREQEKRRRRRFLLGSPVVVVVALR